MPGHGTRNRHHRDQFKVQSTNCERHNQIPSAKRGPPGIINPDVSAGSNRKKARREGASVPNFAGPVANRRQQDRQQPQIAVPMNIHDLPDELLLLVFEKLQMHRFPAASVCKRWKALADDRSFVRRVSCSDSINDAIAAASPGETIYIEAGMYTETVLLDKPLKIVGEVLPTLSGIRKGFRNSVVLMAKKRMVAFANARVLLQNLSCRNDAAAPSCTIIGVGHGCDYMRLEHCDLAGDGIRIPSTKDPKTQVVLFDCDLSCERGCVAAIGVESGTTRITGCRIVGGDIAIDVSANATCHVQHCDISFNAVACCFDGCGSIMNNILWGNRSTLDLVQTSSGERPCATGPLLCEGSTSQGVVQPATPVGGGAAPSTEPTQDVAATPAAAVGRPAGAANRRHRQAQRNTRNYVKVSGNHIRLPTYRSTASAKQCENKKRICQLATETYGTKGGMVPEDDENATDQEMDMSDDSTDVDTDLSNDDSDESDGDVSDDGMNPAGQAAIDIGWLAGIDQAAAEYGSDASDVAYDPED